MSQLLAQIEGGRGLSDADAELLIRWMWKLKGLAPMDSKVVVHESLPALNTSLVADGYRWPATGHACAQTNMRRRGVSDDAEADRERVWLVP